MPASVTLEPVAPHHAAGEEFAFAIMNEESKLVGVTGLVDVTTTEAELGFWIGKPYWNRGFATAAAHQAVQFAFEEVDLERVFARPLARNPPRAACWRSWASSSSKRRRTSIRSGPTPTGSHAIASTAAPGARPADECRHRLIAARARLVAREVVLTRGRRYLKRCEYKLGTRGSGATVFAHPDLERHLSAHSCSSYCGPPMLSCAKKKPNTSSAPMTETT